MFCQNPLTEAVITSHKISFFGGWGVGENINLGGNHYFTKSGVMLSIRSCFTNVCTGLLVFILTVDSDLYAVSQA